jgi:plasmid stabilization system protein ParE
MTYRVITQPDAEAEAEEAFRWLYEQSPEAAVGWYQGLREAIQSLAEHPHRCPVAPEAEGFSEPVRQLLYGKRRGIYRILFLIRGQIVHVISIRHGARQPRPLTAPDTDADQAQS